MFWSSAVHDRRPLSLFLQHLGAQKSVRVLRHRTQTSILWPMPVFLNRLLLFRNTDRSWPCCIEKTMWERKDKFHGRERHKPPLSNPLPFSTFDRRKMSNKNTSSLQKAQKTSTNAGASQRAGQRRVVPVACRVLKVSSSKSRSCSSTQTLWQSQPTSMQPAGQFQQQGLVQVNYGECALSVTSPSTLTLFGNRWTVHAACCKPEMKMLRIHPSELTEETED